MMTDRASDQTSEEFRHEAARATSLAAVRLASTVSSLPPSGIRAFFELLDSVEGVISLAVGQPDFATPAQIHRRRPPTRCSPATPATPATTASSSCASALSLQLERLLRRRLLARTRTAADHRSLRGARHRRARPRSTMATRCSCRSRATSRYEPVILLAGAQVRAGAHLRRVALHGHRRGATRAAHARRRRRSSSATRATRPAP